MIRALLPAIADGDARRVIAAAALLASDRDGEALGAARAVCRLLAPHKLRPDDVFRAAFAPAQGDHSRGARPDPVRPQARHQVVAAMCLRCPDWLNEWEKNFLVSVARERSLSPRQQEKLNAIAAKIEAKVQEAVDDPDF